jgi:hypothetical protein
MSFRALELRRKRLYIRINISTDQSRVGPAGPALFYYLSLDARHPQVPPKAVLGLAGTGEK